MAAFQASMRKASCYRPAVALRPERRDDRQGNRAWPTGRLGAGTAGCLPSFHLDTAWRTSAMDLRDRLILALAAQLRAERETRQAFADAVRGGLGREVMIAMLEDPVPAITQLDLTAADALAAGARNSQSRAA